MSESNFRELFRKAEESLTYQVEGSILDFTEDLCGVMNEQGVTRAELARRLGTSPAYVTKILRGRSNFTLASMVRVATALGCEVRLHLALRGAMTRWIDDLSSVAVSSASSVSVISGPKATSATTLIEAA
jgi:transcriptional regulator with XRE-family HTH domain